MGILYPDLCTDSSSFFTGQDLLGIANIKIQDRVAEAIGEKIKTKLQV
jgi:hypothetical protein